MSIITGPQIQGVNTGIPVNKNWLINSDMNISQRGDFTSATSASNAAYYLDREKTWISTVTATVQQVTSNQPSGLAGTSSLKYVATSTAIGALGSQQIIEDGKYLRGNSFTYSRYVKSNSSEARLHIWDGSTYTSSSAHTGGGAWERLTVTATIDASATTITCGTRLVGNTGSTVSITSGDYIEHTAGKGELSSSATDYELSRRSKGEELTLCKRYYQKSYAQGTTPTTATVQGMKTFYPGTNVGNGQQVISHEFGVTMRTTPTVTTFDYSGNSGKCSVFVDSGASSSHNEILNMDYITDSFFRTRCQVVTGGVKYGFYFHWTADAEL